MKFFFPKSGSEADWNAACYRLEDYLRAWHVENKVQQSQIIMRVLHAIAPKHELNPELNPTTLALEEIRRLLEQWFQNLEPEQDARLTAARVAMVMGDADGQWARVMLADELPPSFVQSFQESRVQAGPDLQISSMVPRPLDEPTLNTPAADLAENSLLVPLLVIGTAALLAVLLFIR